MKLVSFDEWTVRGKWRIGTGSFKGPALAVVFHHSVTRLKNPFILMVVAIEEIIWGRRITSGFSMVAYNFIITPDGTIWEGRGTRWRNGANTRTKRGVPYSNRNTLSICFAGNFHPGSIPVMLPTPEALQAAAELTQHLRREGHLVPGHDFVPHSLLHSTACCGNELRAMIPAIRFQTNQSTEDPTMFVLKTSETAPNGWVIAGPRVLLTTSIAHWESVVGPNNVFISEHAQSFMDKTEPQPATIPESTYVGPSADTIADRVLAKIKAVWK